MLKIQQRLDPDINANTRASHPVAMLTLPLATRVKARFKATLDDGQEVGVLLPRGAILRGGDLLLADNGQVIKIVAAAELLSVVSIDDAHLLARACYHLGNRHVALQVLADELRYQHDHVLDSMLHGFGITTTCEHLPFEPEPGAYGEHGSDHAAHDHHSHHSQPIAHEHHPKPVKISAPTLAESSLAQVRLMQLVSPNLPTGAFTYSQGLEYAIECQWVTDMDSLHNWLQGMLQECLAYLEVPIFRRSYEACEQDNVAALQKWANHLLASRETSELRQEERNRARALTRLLSNLALDRADEWVNILNESSIAAFALVASDWRIPLQDAAQGYVWSWLENQVAAAIKLVPLGQTQGQSVQLALAQLIPNIVQTGLQVGDADIGGSAPALAIASSLHETQYTRLFRS